MAFGELPIVTASRELWEETAIFIPALHFHHIGFTRDVFPDCRYLTAHYIANSNWARPIVREPDKCATWKWFDMRSIPDNLFLPCQNALEQIQFLKSRRGH